MKTLLLATVLAASSLAVFAPTNAEAGIRKHCRDTSFYVGLFQKCKNHGNLTTQQQHGAARRGTVRALAPRR